MPSVLLCTSVIGCVVEALRYHISCSEQPTAAIIVSAVAAAVPERFSNQAVPRLSADSKQAGNSKPASIIFMGLVIHRALCRPGVLTQISMYHLRFDELQLFVRLPQSLGVHHDQQQL